MYATNRVCKSVLNVKSQSHRENGLHSVYSYRCCFEVPNMLKFHCDPSWLWRLYTLRSRNVLKIGETSMEQ